MDIIKRKTTFQIITAKVISLNILFLCAGGILLLSGIPLIFEPSAYNIIREESYFYFLALISLLYISTYYLLRRSDITLCLNLADLFFLLFILYAVLRSVFITPHKIPSDNFLKLGLIAVFYLVFKHITRKNKDQMANAFITVLLFAGYFEVISSYLQWFRVIPNLHPVFSFAGTFGNPGPFTIYLAAVNTILFNYLLGAGNNLKKVKKILIYILIFLSLALIAIAKIRSSWIAMAAGTCMVIFLRFNFWGKFQQLQIYKRLLIIGGCCIFIVLMFMGLLAFKKDSASGRIFIWKNTISMIKDQPLFGVGYKNYIYSYNNYQSKAFVEGNYSEKDYFLADNVCMAFNDFLQITAEVGIIGLVLFLTMLIYIANYALPVLKQNNYFITGIIGALTAILCASLFSYPLTILRIQVMFVLCLAMVSGIDKRNKFSVRLTQIKSIMISAIFILVCITLFVIQIMKYNNFRKWNNTLHKLKDGYKKETIYEYNRLYGHFNDYFFLFNYSAVLINYGSYHEALDILDKTGEFINSYEYYMNLGNCYYKLNYLMEAERAYTRALSIIPSRIMPRYNVFKCAVAEGNYEKAQSMGNEILHCKIKIDNELTDTIRTLVSEYLKNEPQKEMKQ